MMVEVMHTNDIGKITSSEVQTYLFKRFKEINYPLIAHVEGYFLYVKDFSLLYKNHQLNYLILPSISEGLFDHIEGISIDGDIVEVSLLFNNEFLMSLVFSGLDQQSLEMINKEEKVAKKHI